MLKAMLQAMLGNTLCTDIIGDGGAAGGHPKCHLIPLLIYQKKTSRLFSQSLRVQPGWGALVYTIR